MLDAMNADIIASQDLTPWRDIAVYAAEIIGIAASIGLPLAALVVFVIYRYIVREEKNNGRPQRK